MQTKNLTPFLFGAKPTSLKPRALQMTLIVRASFRLRPGAPLDPIVGLMDQGPLTGDVFRDDDDDRAGECLYASDFADFKLHAEVMLAGACHAPGGRPVTECPVRFSVGAFSKTLLVVGRRVWTERLLGAAISDPEPFVTLPLGYASSFGGPTHAPNPVGKGRDTPELPRVEHPAARVRGKGDRPEPAGFGPLNPAWPARAGKVGTEYGARWRKERAPFYAEDFDWTYFNAAPADQQLPGYLRGDEEISFVNLHPDAPIFSARLPGLRVRAFVRVAEGAVREARMQLDTLLADLEEERLVLTWRGLTPVEEDDLADVKTVIIASERLADPALPEAHYRAILEAFEADPLELERHAPGARQALSALDAASRDNAAHPDRSPAERAQAALQDEAALLGIVPLDQRAALGRALAAAKEKLASTPRAPASAPAAGSARPAAAVADLADALQKLKLERTIDDPQTKKRLASLLPPLPEEIGPGKDLSDRTLAGMDLSGQDLSGANLERANLLGARLVGARLVGANLKQAVLAQADLSRADLSDADLTQATLSGARAPGADLRRTTLDQTVLDEINLRGATLAEARGQMTTLSGADLTEADLSGCDLYKAFADAPLLERANLTEARLLQCAFLHARAEGATLTRALLNHTSFAGSDLRRATFREARGERTSLERAVIEEADFCFAVLVSAHFSEAKATRARFFGADLRGAELYRACLDRADFERANLFGANLGKTTLNGTRFRHANLYDARFLGAGGQGCDLEGANVERAMLPAESS